MDQWFVCVPDGDPVGPVSTSLLILGIRSGKVPEDALVCRVGETSWRGVLEAAELVGALPGAEAFDGSEAATRYAVKNLLGQGGMGEVYLCADEWIGRDVAMKIAHEEQAGQAHLRARFVREALVQGQLEHPSVVPVYDLGRRPDGAIFFTMKRVRGLTLAAIIDGLRRKDPAIERAYSRRRVLSAMSNVCLAVSFAHSRGVVHRDLKPENVMLGDFGEVYVLDWGVAKVLEDAWANRASTALGAPVGKTQAGALVGTVGYASPEQVRGDKTVGPASDVYALGAILFELLALAPLHAGNDAEALMAATLSSTGGRPSESANALGIPPELDDICARATAATREARFESARAMQESIERYLDGERDEERRRELARQHADAARRAFEDAARGGADAETGRVRGLRELGAALALEPSNEDAVQTLMRVLLEAPGELPPEAEAELRMIDREDRLRAARDGMVAYSLMALTLPIVLRMHILRPWLFAALVGVIVVTVSYQGWMWRTGDAQRPRMRWAVPMSFLVVAMTASIFGPLVMAPGVAAITVAGFAVSLRANQETKRALLLLGLGAILVPLALEYLGLAPASYAFEDGSIRILSNLVEFRPVPSLLLLALGSIMTIVATYFSVGRAVDALVASERRNFAQAWRLRQILPVRQDGAA